MIDLKSVDLRINLGELIHHCALQFADRPCITMADHSDSVTYREFESRINRIAHGLQQQVNGASRYVAIMLENSITYVALTYALKKTQQIEVSINRAFRGPALSRTINLTECKTLFTSAAHFDALLQVMPDLTHLQTLVVTDDASAAQQKFPHLKIVSFDALMADDDSHITSDASDLDTAAIMFTSGTTGVSKGCMLLHRYAVRTAQNMLEPFRITGMTPTTHRIRCRTSARPITIFCRAFWSEAGRAARWL